MAPLRLDIIVTTVLLATRVALAKRLRVFQPTRDATTGERDGTLLRLRTGFLALAAVLLTLPEVVADGESAQIRAGVIQDRCLQYRMDHTDHGWMTIRVQQLVPSADGVVPTGEGTTTRVVFDGNCLRNDLVSSDPESRPSLQKVVCDHYYIEVFDPDVTATKAPVSEYGGAAGAIQHLGMIHPRWIGMGNNPLTQLMQGTEFRAVPVKADVAPTVVIDDEIDGTPAIKIEYQNTGVTSFRTSDDGPPDDRKFSRRRTLWFGQEMGYSLLKYRSSMLWVDAQKEVVSELVSQYNHDPITDTWFPRESTRIVATNGEFRLGERIVVEDVHWETPDASQFAVGAIQLADGQHLFDRTQGKFQKDYRWDGNELLAIPSAVEHVDVTKPASMSSRRWFLILNAVVLFLVGVWLLWRTWLKAKNARDSGGT